MTEEEIKLKQEANEAQDAKAKELGAVVCLRVEDKDGIERVAYLKAPDRYAVGYALSELSGGDILKGCEYIYDSAVMKDISPDYQLIRDEDYLFISVHKAIQAAIPFKKNNSKIL